MTCAKTILGELHALASPERARGMQHFFKTGPGEYGEGDCFLGISVPLARTVVRRHKALVAPEELGALLASPWHEARFVALVLITEHSLRADDAGRRMWADFYLEHRAGVNNWDLVDVSAPQVLGSVACDDPKILWILARSGNLWDERMAMLATFFDIRRGRFDLTLALAEHFIGNRQDLMHKAAGWLLRETGKRDEGTLRAFLNAHASVMPRTMLRYAIEKFEPEERKHFLKFGTGKTAAPQRD
ncbi:MAG: DNA alkylation repair protein [Puniceicoccales bacterium]|jgi:3-methyladenine DNA glycosylase AlkD|nr:DNA alkylation repair protein [Puniceicoccales bacterium]